MDNFQYISDIENLRSTLLDFNLEYGKNYDREVVKAFQTILKFLDVQQTTIEKQIENKFRN